MKDALDSYRCGPRCKRLDHTHTRTPPPEVESTETNVPTRLMASMSLSHFSSLPQASEEKGVVPYTPPAAGVRLPCHRVFIPTFFFRCFCASPSPPPPYPLAIIWFVPALFLKRTLSQSFLFFHKDNGRRFSLVLVCFAGLVIR
uniref:Uncharacterized protein n=1 Tax=Leishmania donovani TaxID=5661 RepID=Q962F7_LEIDO|nr:hypothetical protein [Leishmania donovani]